MPLHPQGTASTVGRRRPLTLARKAASYYCKPFKMQGWAQLMTSLWCAWLCHYLCTCASLLIAWLCKQAQSSCFALIQIMPNLWSCVLSSCRPCNHHNKLLRKHRVPSTHKDACHQQSVQATAVGSVELSFWLIDLANNQGLQDCKPLSCILCLVSSQGLDPTSSLVCRISSVM